MAAHYCLATVHKSVKVNRAQPRVKSVMHCITACV